MEGDLNRSVRLLDDAASSLGRNLFRRSFRNRDFENTQCSVFIDNNEDHAIKYKTDAQITMGQTMFDLTLANCTLSHDQPKRPSAASENLYMEFFEILQTHTESNELLKTIAEMSRSCADTLSIIREANGKLMNRRQDDSRLENERNTWRLLYILYSDRLNSQLIKLDDVDLSSYIGLSEKYCMLSLFKRNNLVRECQLVVDWLECNSAQKDDEVLHFSDSSMGWENTLHQLKSRETIVFEASHKIVSSMDPDAPHYQNLPLHDIDVEDDKKLCYKMFHLIRCGKLKEAQKLCSDSGHSWRAALLEGWKLYHNPNLEDKFSQEYDDGFADEDSSMDNNKTIEIEGNEIRDIWKETAWNYSNHPTLDKYEKASVAAFCGNLKCLLNVCSNWEDFLWAQMRVMIDIRVESELRENVTKSYRDMPKAYWEQRMSINEIFAALEASKHKNIQREALTFDHIIQKFIILDEINNLVDVIADWILDTNINTQFLRFLTHLLLFLEQIDQVANHDIVEKVIEEYIKRLIQDKQTQLVAYYASKLNETTQIHIYSTYLETIIDNNQRKEALKYAEDSGLNVYLLTYQIVENIRGRHDHENEQTSHTTKNDEFKINSLDWLLFSNQLADLVHQSNALIYQFLSARKHDAAQLAFGKVPVDAIQKLTCREDIPEELQQTVREHLSYKSYFDAQEAFNDWFHQFKSKPTEPECPPDGAPFTKKVEYEHKLSQFNAENARWRITTEQSAKLAKTALYNMLLFPDGGWLHGAKESNYMKFVFIPTFRFWLQGAKEANHLQKIYIPECVLLLFNVLYDSEQFEECVQLADLVASRRTQLYKYFETERLHQLLQKLAEGCVASLKQGRDPWGDETRA